MCVMTRLPRSLVLLAVVLFGGTATLAACGNETQLAAPAGAEAPVDTNTVTTEGNLFLPEDENVSSCVGTLERPDCGSKSKGGWRMYLTFAVLMAGMGFIGWRIARGVKARDAVVNSAPDAGSTPAADDSSASAPPAPPAPVSADADPVE